MKIRKTIMALAIAVGLAFGSPITANAGKIAGLPTGTPGLISENTTLYEEWRDIKKNANLECEVSKGTKVKLIKGYDGYKVVKVKVTGKSCEGWTHSSNFIPLD